MKKKFFIKKICCSLLIIAALLLVTARISYKICEDQSKKVLSDAIYMYVKGIKSSADIVLEADKVSDESDCFYEMSEYSNRIVGLQLALVPSLYDIHEDYLYGLDSFASNAIDMMEYYRDKDTLSDNDRAYLQKVLDAGTKFMNNIDSGKDIYKKNEFFDEVKKFTQACEVR